MKAIISRTYGASETIGSFFAMNGEGLVYRCKTIELPDLGNQKNFSCIPEGIYDVEKIISPNKNECFHVLNVPNRDSILIHKGNYAAGYHVDTLGCILPGSRFEDVNSDGNLDVVESGKTMNDLLTLLPDKFKLIII